MKTRKLTRRRKILVGIFATVATMLILTFQIFLPSCEKESTPIETTIEAIEIELNQPAEDQDIQRIIELIVFLGDERASQASSILVETIGIKIPEIDRPISRYLVEELYPSIDALIKIGKPASQYILRGIDTATDDTQIRLMTYTLAKISSPDMAKEQIEILASPNATRALEWLQIMYSP